MLLRGDSTKEEAWKEVTDLWWQLEVSTDFVSPVKGFASTGRPGEIHNWIKSARKGTPAIGSIDAFAMKWACWWAAINLEWCVKDGALLKDTIGLWERFNGFLSVLVALLWWREGCGEQVDKRWLEAVADVAFVIGLLTSGASGAAGGSRTHEDDMNVA
ncbi:hypothetical protein DFH09DRAFT_1327954 [Mycena vulgaris]|nr:hypothetical protein DFH09DRAFT_1327954 [Mycena vulgaris]